MTLLDYHRLQSQEARGWDRVQMEAAVRAQDPGFPERVEALLPAGDYKTPVAEGLPIFEQMRGLCELWLRATSEQRAYVRSRIDRHRAYLLGGFRAHAKRLAVEQNSDAWLRLALASLGIDNLNCTDARDVIMSMDGLLAVSRKIHADWGTLVRSVAALSGPGMAALFADCLRNHPA